VLHDGCETQRIRAFNAEIQCDKSHVHADWQIRRDGGERKFPRFLCRTCGGNRFETKTTPKLRAKDDNLQGEKEHSSRARRKRSKELVPEFKHAEF
jgi:transposase-like protein